MNYRMINRFFEILIFISLVLGGILGTLAASIYLFGLWGIPISLIIAFSALFAYVEIKEETNND